MTRAVAKHLWLRRWVVRLILLSLLAASGFTLLNVRLSDPEGLWDAPEIGVEGYSFIEFRDGHVEAVTQYGRKALGTYWKKQGRWFFDGGDGQVYEIRLSWFTMNMLLPDGRPAERPRRRLFWRPSGS